MKAFVSSYAAASPRAPWDPEAEAALFAGFERLDIAGLEIPYFGRLHAHDDGWLMGQLRPEWRLLVTLLPGTMERLKSDRHFGLASADREGRLRALDFAENARRTVQHLHAYLGLKAVSAVAVHSSPRPDGAARADAAAFAESLRELRRRDWSGAELLVEHCDAAVAGRAPDKGFLGLRDEIAAIAAAPGPTPARIMINWGRSAVESRSARGPLEHIDLARSADLLAGLFFSGVTPEHKEYGAWRDAHAPFSTVCPESILTPAAAKAALEHAGELSYLGLKIQPLPAGLGAAERLAMIRDGLDVIRPFSG